MAFVIGCVKENVNKSSNVRQNEIGSSFKKTFFSKNVQNKSAINGPTDVRGDQIRLVLCVGAVSVLELIVVLLMPPS